VLNESRDQGLWVDTQVHIPGESPRKRVYLMRDTAAWPGPWTNRRVGRDLRVRYSSSFIREPV